MWRYVCTLWLLSGGVLSREAVGETGGGSELQSHFRGGSRWHGSKGEEIAHAKAYNVSDPVFTCTKPGYILNGEDCVFENRVRARFECPLGYRPEGGEAFRPERCVKVSRPEQICSAGATLREGVCQECGGAEPSSECPRNSTETAAGGCVGLEPVTAVEQCPEAATKVNNQCILIEYREPQYVCPGDSVQEGRKCRREVVTFRAKKRRLADGAADADEEDDDSTVFSGMSDLPAKLFETADENLSGECKGCVDEATWVPADGRHGWNGKVAVQPPALPTAGGGAAAGGGYKTKGARIVGGKAAAKLVSELGLGGVIDAGIPGGIPPAIPPGGSNGGVISGPVRVKYENVKAAKLPTQVIKVQTLPADRVCEVGQRHGGICVSQQVVPPRLECPVPLVDGQCARAVNVPPTATCPPDAALVCPPRIPGARCQCETCVPYPPLLACPGGRLEGDRCIYTADPKPYCPIGYFLEPDRLNCLRRDTEAALCLFSVTYVCPDCDYPKN